jgi:hypothetical protein
MPVVPGTIVGSIEPDDCRYQSKTADRPEKKKSGRPTVRRTTSLKTRNAVMFTEMRKRA